MSDKTVRAKMKCSAVGNIDGQGHHVEMEPVTCGSDENEKFFKYTPGGCLKLSVMNDMGFEPGKEYYIDITEAPATE